MLKIGDEVYVYGYIDEIRRDTVIIKNKGGYFGTVEDEINIFPIVRCEDCKNADFSGLHGGRLFCLKHDCYMYADDFCSIGEREDS